MNTNPSKRPKVVSWENQQNNTEVMKNKSGELHQKLISCKGISMSSEYLELCVSNAQNLFVDKNTLLSLNSYIDTGKIFLCKIIVTRISLYLKVGGMK